MKKRKIGILFLVLVMALSVAFAFAGCGSAQRVSNVSEISTSWRFEHYRIGANHSSTWISPGNILNISADGSFIITTSQNNEAVVFTGTIFIASNGRVTMPTTTGGSGGFLRDWLGRWDYRAHLHQDGTVMTWNCQNVDALFRFVRV